MCVRRQPGALPGQHALTKVAAQGHHIPPCPEALSRCQGFARVAKSGSVSSESRLCLVDCRNVMVNAFFLSASIDRSPSFDVRTQRQSDH